jgi:hypothetical protein
MNRRQLRTRSKRSNADRPGCNGCLPRPEHRLCSGDGSKWARGGVAGRGARTCIRAEKSVRKSESDTCPAQASHPRASLFTRTGQAARWAGGVSAARAWGFEADIGISAHQSRPQQVWQAFQGKSGEIKAFEPWHWQGTCLEVDHGYNLAVLQRGQTQGSEDAAGAAGAARHERSQLAFTTYSWQHLHSLAGDG